MSVEADIAIDSDLARLDVATDESELADRIDGAIGEGSMFHQTFGYYAQGVETTTAVLTDGWRDRLVPLICESADPIAVGWCLERHDLWVAKQPPVGRRITSSARRSRTQTRNATPRLLPSMRSMRCRGLRETRAARAPGSIGIEDRRSHRPRGHRQPGDPRHVPGMGAAERGDDVRRGRSRDRH